MDETNAKNWKAINEKSVTQYHDEIFDNLEKIQSGASTLLTKKKKLPFSDKSILNMILNNLKSAEIQIRNLSQICNEQNKEPDADPQK